MEDKFKIDYRSKTILEIGSGLGGYLFYILKKGAGFVIGIDISEFAVAKSLEFINKHYVGKNFRIIKADACELSPLINSKTIDIVVSDAVLEYIIHLNKVFQEISRILKPGGMACLATSPLWFTPNGG